MSRLQTPVRKNDTVVVVGGKDRGKRGRVLKVLPDRNRLVVESVNFVKRHTRPDPQRNVKGGIRREGSLTTWHRMCSWYAQSVANQRGLGISCSETAGRFGSAGNVRGRWINEPLTRPLSWRCCYGTPKRVRVHEPYVCPKARSHRG